MDLTSPKTIKSIQNQFGFTFKKGLGQNFLTSHDVLDEIVTAAEIDGGVVEVGPGFGVLTRELSEAADKVVSIELDERLLEVLNYTLSDCGNVKIVNGDVLKLDLKTPLEEEFPNQKVSFAANLPYYITTPIITRLLEARLPIKNIVVMVQKEVAMRLQAKPATKDYGAITLLCKYYTEPELITVVPAGLFVPPPKVDSAVLKLRVLDKPRVTVKNEKIFFRVIKAAFSQRRKTLLNCLVSGFDFTKAELAVILQSAGIDGTRRGETLSIEEFAELSDKITERTEEK